MCSFTSECNGDIELVSILINSELEKIADWHAVNKLSLNVQKTKFMIFHYRQKIIMGNDIPSLMINNTLIEQVTEFNFLGLTINEYINWNSHTKKIANKISRILGVMNRLKRYLPLSAIKLMYDSLILSHVQFGIINYINLNGVAYQNCKNVPFGSWQEVGIMHIRNHFSNSCIFFKVKTYLRFNA